MVEFGAEEEKQGGDNQGSDNRTDPGNGEEKEDIQVK